MKLFLKSLDVKRFKGIEQFKLMFNPVETNVYGANATGKTTLADAFFFVFNGKDSQDRQAKDWIQTLDDENNKIHRIEHEAEVVLDLDGDTITLARKVKEKWTKPKGQKDEVLAETLEYTYYIDGVPTPAKKFDQFIKDKFMADIMHLLCNPMAFCSMDWKKQREMLYQVCGAATDEEVIATDARFSFLKDALKHKDIETLKAALRKTAATLKDEIKALDAVIKDRKQSLIKEFDRDVVIAEKDEKEIRIADLTKQLDANNDVFEKIKEKQSNVLELEKACEATRKAYEDEFFSDQRKAKERLSTLKSDIVILTSKQKHVFDTLERCNKEIVILDQQISDRRDEWKARHSQVLNDSDKVCPCCGQDMPTHKLDEINGKFETDKNLDLEKILNHANRLKSAKATEETKIRANEKMLDEIEADLLNAQNGISECEVVLSSAVAPEPFDASSFDQEIAALQKEIEAFKTVDTSAVKEAIELEHKQLQLIMIRLHKCDAYDRGLEEIKQKEQEKHDKQAVLADTEMDLINATDFVTTKVTMLEDKVNSKFETVKFKLFKMNQKGNYEETCTALVDGVDWMIANTAAKVQAGIEIINSLQNHFDFYCPVIVDNRESVTEIPTTQAQVLNLIVNENDKELRVE